MQPKRDRKILSYLAHLTEEIGARPTGSDANVRACEWFEETLAATGFTTERMPFSCLHFKEEGGEVAVGGETFTLTPSPYSLPCECAGILYSAKTVEDVRTKPVTGNILLIHGALAREQITPKHYPFYSVDVHDERIALLEERPPAAIIALTTISPPAAGALSPFPLFEDGDFDIPSLFMHAEEGVTLIPHEGERARVTSRIARIPASGWNVLARKNEGAEKKIVITAHIDTKHTTCGALDNGAGIVTLLLLAEMFAAYDGPFEIELIAMNGEDYYSAAGECAYLPRLEQEKERIALAINIDAVGYKEGECAFSFYGVSHNAFALLRSAVTSVAGCVVGEPWHQGDHMLFIQAGVPTLALTTDRVLAIMGEFIHTERDTVDMVSPLSIHAGADGIAHVIHALSSTM